MDRKANAFIVLGSRSAIPGHRVNNIRPGLHPASDCLCSLSRYLPEAFAQDVYLTYHWLGWKARVVRLSHGAGNALPLSWYGSLSRRLRGVALDQPLPVVPIPLLPNDDDVPLALELAFTTVYDAIGYDVILDYTKPCEVPLRGKAAAWAVRQLAAWKT